MKRSCKKDVETMYNTDYLQADIRRNDSLKVD